MYEGVECRVVEILRNEEKRAISSGNTLAAAFWRSYQLMSYGLIRDEKILDQQDFDSSCFE